MIGGPLPARAAAAVATAALAAAGLNGCAAAPEGPTPLTVAAASSLAAVFEPLAARFSEREQVAVRLTFAGSSELVAQLEQGLPADVIVTADERTMVQAQSAGVAGESQAFASNALEIAVPLGDPAGVDSVDDLARPGVRLVVCAPQVPCGAAAAVVADRAGISLRPVSEESSATDVLGKVAAGEADAGLVWRTDVLRGEGRVSGVALPEELGATTRYFAAVVPDAGAGGTGDPAAADAASRFAAFLRGGEAGELLAAAGFGAP